MQDRIRKFMDYKGLSSSELADTIGVQRSNVTHVLQGRNKPSFPFIEKLLQTYPELNAKWLMLGSGSMVDTPAKARTLFDQDEVQKPAKPGSEVIKKQVVAEEVPETIAPKSPESEKKEEKQPVKNDYNVQFFSSEKPIERLIVFYNDQTFKVYNPSL